MTSETKEDEEKKRTLKIHRYLQRHKAKLGWILSAALTTTLLGYVPPYPTLVSCDDPSIRLPYQPDTISVKLLLWISLALPFIMMTALEWADAPANNENSALRQGLRRSWCYLGDLFVGGLFMFFINDLAKLVTSEARPCFWSICSPNFTKEQCEQQYVSVFWTDCTNPLELSHPRVVDSMKSFPSGHASVSVFSSVFIMVYVKARVWNKSYGLVVPCVQLMWAIWAYICCQSRIWDNKHHWWDVLSGALLGAFGAFLTLKYLSNWFIREEIIKKPRIPGDSNYIQQQDEST